MVFSDASNQTTNRILMKIIVNVQTLQEYQAVKTFELGQPISVTNSTITFPTDMTVEVDEQPDVKAELTFAEFERHFINPNEYEKFKN